MCDVTDYQDARDKWVHEDNLVNQRLSWLILSQTILFAAYSVLITTNNQANTVKINALIDAIPWGGIFISLVTLVALMGGLYGQYKHRENWELTKPTRARTITLNVPVTLMGLLPPFVLPLSFIGAWFWISSLE